jgi:hypothetical protein
VSELVVVERGRRLQEGPDWVVFVIGVVLLGVSAALRRQRRRLDDDSA